MQILANFGFEPYLFLAQIVNFLIIYWLLKKFLYKPVLKLLEDRKQKIAKGLKDAEESERLLQETLQKEEEILKDAQEKARKLIDEARAQSESMLKQAEEETKKKVDSMLLEARAQITYETEVAEKRLSANIGQVAVEFLEKSLTGLFGEKEEELIMKKAIAKLKKAD